MGTCRHKVFGRGRDVGFKFCDKPVVADDRCKFHQPAAVAARAADTDARRAEAEKAATRAWFAARGRSI